MVTRLGLTNSTLKGATDTSLVACLSSVKDEHIKQHLEAFNAYQNFWSERVPTPAAVAYLATKPKARQRAALEKRGKLLTYSKLSVSHQKLLDASRLKE